METDAVVVVGRVSRDVDVMFMFIAGGVLPLDMSVLWIMVGEGGGDGDEESCCGCGVLVVVVVVCVCVY